MSVSRRLRRTIPVLALACVLATALTACSTTDPEVAAGPVAAAADVRVVSPAAAADLLAQTPAPTLIDVRTPGEYAEGHLAGAILVDYNGADFRDRIAELPRDGSYVIYCRSGNRSAGARAVMTELGFSDVADIDGGIMAWVEAGLPTTTA